MAAAPQTTKNLGVFDDEQKAASAYDTAVRPAAAARLALTTEESKGCVGVRHSGETSSGSTSGLDYGRVPWSSKLTGYPN